MGVQMSVSDLNAENLIRLLSAIYDLPSFNAGESHDKSPDESHDVNASTYQFTCDLI
jgi:hypothetical protein